MHSLYGNLWCVALIQELRKRPFPTGLDPKTIDCRPYRDIAHRLMRVEASIETPIGIGDTPAKNWSIWPKV